MAVTSFDFQPLLDVYRTCQLLIGNFRDVLVSEPDGDRVLKDRDEQTPGGGRSDGSSPIVQARLVVCTQTASRCILIIIATMPALVNVDLVAQSPEWPQTNRPHSWPSEA
jgi:hypothetical protein